MEDFINRIIEIDKQARKMTIDADSLKNEADKEIAEKNAQVKKKYDEATEKAVSNYKANEQLASDNKLAAKKAYYEKVSADFGEIFKNDKKKWVDELVSRTLA